MDNYPSIEVKLRNAISALTSGVLTSLIYDSISSSSYILEIDGKQHIISSIETSSWGAIGFILATFLFLWAIISVLIPLILRIKKRFEYAKIKRISSMELVRTLDIAKETIINLYPIFYPGDDTRYDSELVKLYSRDLASIILLLHKNFLPPNQKTRKIIMHYFRYSDHSSIITINKKVSAYEFRSIITLLRRMVICVIADCDDKLLRKDCTEMKQALDELDDLLTKEK